MLSSLGRARYKAVTVVLKKGFSERTQFLAHYTWSRDESNADPEREVLTLGPSNAHNLEDDFALMNGTSRIVSSSKGQRNWGPASR